jgi:Na+/H+ antiporter NhaC
MNEMWMVFAMMNAGYELSLIEESYTSLTEEYDLAGQGWEMSPFLVFVKTIPGRYYPIAMLCLQAMLVLTQRDFGPMFRAERRALREGKVSSDSADSEQVTIPDETLMLQ